eukprot:GHUV01043904.1.p1 GENE.GHUV01043904.1~~GHUV01043904.1.p1  ORF type:complete len:106 (-),score=18.38 GHUV01043904.1:551-868(-)
MDQEPPTCFKPIIEGFQSHWLLLLLPSLLLQLAREVSLHLKCCHPYITALYAAYKDNRNIYLLMELAPQGNLYQMLMNMALPQVGWPGDCGVLGGQVLLVSHRGG